MINPAQIPDEVVEAAARAIGEETYVGNKQTLRDAGRAAIAAALNTWPGERLRAHLKTAIWSDSEECKLLTADNERLRAALRQIKRGSVWNCDIEAFIDAALAEKKKDDL